VLGRNVQPANTARQIELPTNRDRLHVHVAWHLLRPPTMLAVHHAHATPTATRGYARRHPEDTVLYGVVQDHLATLLDTARDHSEHGFGYPRFVEREFEKFFACGLLCNGFVRVRCDTCAEERLVAFSCKTRGFCPSCTSRRMANTAADLVDRVLPIVPYRQWVLSLPRRVRFLLARDSELLNRALGVFLAKLFAWQRRRARAHSIADPHVGAITFVQRFGSLLNLNCHAHAVLPDEVFAAGFDGDVQFHPLPPPWDDDVARLPGQTARAIHRLVERYLAQRGDDEPLDLLAAEQAQAIATLPWPDRAPSPSPTSHRSAFLDDYSLHANRLIDANDREGLERLCRYGTRSPVANARLSLDPTGRVALFLKRPLRDGRTELTFMPIDFLRRLATLIPPPRHHLTRYHGVFAPHHHLRAAIVHTAAADPPN
jgi:Putative transposase/Transposase zinc-binding domain